MSPKPPRRPVHTRSIRIDVYSRDDGLWDLEATLVDTKARDFMLATGVRKQGDPVHEMHLTITINTQLDIVDAVARSDWTPYPGECEAYGDAYRRLIGLNLTRDFRKRVRERLGGVAGCTHLTELSSVLPTAAIQAFAGEVFQARDEAGRTAVDEESKPFQLDRCHALRTDGPTVAKFYPRWHRASANASSIETVRSPSE